MKNIQNIFFDLDGTLTNPEEGIINCFEYALKKMGKPSVERSTLSKYIGPPARIAFSILINSNNDIEVEKAIKIYRERFAETGLYEISCLIIKIQIFKLLLKT